MSIARHSHYVPRFTHKDVKRRYLFLSERCVGFVEGMMEQHKTWKLAIDPMLMTSVAISAMDDIWRWKVYHLRTRGKLSDSVKRATYFTKWIVRLKPIYFNGRPTTAKAFRSTFDPLDSTLLINECFALNVALTFLSTEAGSEKKVVLSEKMNAHLLYDLHYRNLTDEGLMEIYNMIRSIVQKEQIIVP